MSKQEECEHIWEISPCLYCHGDHREIKQRSICIKCGKSQEKFADKNSIDLNQYDEIRI